MHNFDIIIVDAIGTMLQSKLYHCLGKYRVRQMKKAQIRCSISLF